MQIQIEIVRTHSTIYLQLNGNDTINRIMELINIKLEIPIEWQQLQLNNGQLIDHNHNHDTLLSQYNIQNGTRIKLNVIVPRYNINSNNNNNNNNSGNETGIGNRQNQQRSNGIGTSSTSATAAVAAAALRIVRRSTTSSSSSLSSKIHYAKKQIRLHRKNFRAKTTIKRRVIL